MVNLKLKKALSGSQGILNLDVDIEISQGQLTTLYGPSGEGKTSILRMISGLMTPDQGHIVVNEEVWFDDSKKVNVAPQKRSVGMLFQDYALFPNMTILENLKFALRREGKKKDIDDIIAIMELEDLKDRRPETLSGGQQQRVALARALIQRPKLLLLDEPLSALDSAMRVKLQQYIVEAHKTFDLTTILVSHDISEIFKMSDNLIVLEDGRISKKGKPVEVFRNKEVSGKFQFAGEIVHMEKQNFIWIISILIGHDIVRVVAENSEAHEFSIGDKVLVASKAFNPIIKKIM